MLHITTKYLKQLFNTGVQLRGEEDSEGHCHPIAGVIFFFRQNVASLKEHLVFYATFVQEY